MNELAKAIRTSRLLVARRTLELEGRPINSSVLNTIAGADSFSDIDTILRENVEKTSLGPVPFPDSSSRLVTSFRRRVRGIVRRVFRMG